MPFLPRPENESAPSRGKAQGAVCFASTTLPLGKNNDDDFVQHQPARVQRYREWQRR